MNPSCKDGAKHLWHSIQRSRYLSAELKRVVDPVIQCNVYFAHPENILLCMITDNSETIRKLGMRHILRARLKKYGIRKFVILLLNFSATSYTNFIDWQNVNLTEPPLLTYISVNDLEMLVASGDIPVIDFPRYLCHTQAVERCIKLVLHQANIEVNEERSKAAAATAMVISTRNQRFKPTFEFKADHPFLSFMRHEYAQLAR